MQWKATTYSFLRQGVSFAADTAHKMWQNLTTIPQVGLQYLINPAARRISNSLVRMLVEDLLPFVVLNHALLCFQQYLDTLYDDEHDSWATFYTLQTISVLLQTSFSLYSLRNTQRLLARSTVLNLENNQMIPQLRQGPEFAICKDANCSTIKFLHGNLRDLGIFYLTEMGIFLISRVNYVGPLLSKSLSIYHVGRYALASAIPEVCQRHQADYLDDNRSLALSLGLTHQILVQTTSQAMNYYLRLPASAFTSSLQFPLLLPIIAIASQLDLPKPVHTERETSKDPLALYESLMGWCIDVILYGLKKKGPKLFEGSDSMIDWQTVRQLADHKIVQFAKLVLIADCFQSMDRIKQDPVIRRFWSKLCLGVADIAEISVSWGKSWQTTALTLNETITDAVINILHWYKRYPKNLVKILVSALKNESVQQNLLDTADYLKKQSKVAAPEKKFYLKQKLIDLTNIVQRCLHINLEDAGKAAGILLSAMRELTQHPNPAQTNQTRKKPSNPLRNMVEQKKESISLRQRQRRTPNLTRKEPPQPLTSDKNLSLFRAKSYEDNRSILRPRTVSLLEPPTHISLSKKKEKETLLSSQNKLT